MAEHLHIGSQFQDEEDNPLFLIKSNKLAENILVMKYVSDDGDNEEIENISVIDKVIVKKI